MATRPPKLHLNPIEDIVVRRNFEELQRYLKSLVGDISTITAAAARLEAAQAAADGAAAETAESAASTTSGGSSSGGGGGGGGGGSTGGTVGDPTDGIFGATGPTAGVESTDTVADAFDKVETILGLLAPAKPQNLLGLALSQAGSYTAKEAVTGTTRTTVTDDTTPTVGVNNFWDGDNGTLSGEIDGVSVGSRALTDADDTGTYGQLLITADEDPYSGIFGQQGFWMQLDANITPSSALSVAPHTFQLKHTITGDSALYTAYLDNPVAPSLGSLSASSTGSSSYVSGVPGLALGQSIAVSFDVINGASKFYNSSQVGRVTSSQTTTLNLNPGAPPAVGATVSLSGNAVVAASAYTESWSGAATGYNSKGATAGGTLTPATPIRIDTVSTGSVYNETTRSKSGTGQFPSKGSGAAQFGDAYVSTDLLSANEELQLLNGNYQYPPAVNYTGKYPAGPNYSALSGGSFSNYRWATFSLGALAAAVNTTINLIGSSGISAVLQTGMILQVMVEGSTGWLDANAAYPGVGNPASNGDPACVVGSSTATSRRVTFGSTPRTGTVWVRIGFPSGSTKTIQGITRT
jgi:hypothetical protein